MGHTFFRVQIVKLHVLWRANQSGPEINVETKWHVELLGRGVSIGPTLAWDNWAQKSPASNKVGPHIPASNRYAISPTKKQKLISDGKSGKIQKIKKERKIKLATVWCFPSHLASSRVPLIQSSKIWRRGAKFPSPELWDFRRVRFVASSSYPNLAETLHSFFCSRLASRSFFLLQISHTVRRCSSVNSAFLVRLSVFFRVSSR